MSDALEWGTTVTGFLMETLVARECQCLANYRSAVNSLEFTAWKSVMYKSAWNNCYV